MTDAQAKHQTYRQLVARLLELVEQDAQRSELRRLTKLAREQAKVETAPEQLEVSSSVSARTLDPFVTIRWGEYEAQLDPEDAYHHVRLVLEAVEAARTDAFMTRFLLEKLEATPEILSTMLQELRGYRAALAERQGPS